jgi:GAF domain-containing protein/anti-sigma regulatory factor (Ser/Thr protein kinase)
MRFAFATLRLDNIYRWDGNALHLVAAHNTPPALTEARRRSPLTAVVARMLEIKTTIHIDAATHQGNIDRGDPGAVSAVELGGVRTVLAVPMLKENELIGSFTVYRQDPRPFTEKQISLVTNFAAQAVIAIENTRLLNELRESLEQQTATADVLRVISSSPGDLGPVFQAMLENAARICGATFGALFLADGDGFRHVAAHNAPLELIEERRRIPVIRPRPGTSIARVAATKRPAQIDDIRAEPAYTDDPGRLAIINAGARTMLSVPMLKDDDLVGQIAIYRQEVQPFNDKQIALLENFAAQAVIAIENARLLNELRQRTNDLSESLQQQTATADVLKIISSSPGELELVFQAMLENATRICEAKFGILLLSSGEGFHTAAMHNVPPALVDARRREPLFRPAPTSALGQMAANKRPTQIADMLAEPGYFDPKPGYSQPQIARLAGARTVVAVPLLKDNELVGAIIIYRQEVRPFTEKQIELVQNFAAQAVIAIENARLLNELRQSLEQQTATSDVLRVISSSPGDLKPVFDAILENATRICEAKFGTLWLAQGNGVFEAVALHNVLPEFAVAWPKRLVQPSPKTAIGRVAMTKQVAHIADLAREDGYIERDPLVVSFVEIAGVRSVLGVPMLKDDVLVGAFFIYRQEVRPFTDKQIELVRNFGAQAVIAIENTRLLNELRESLQQQTATADMLKLISRSTFDLKSVLNTLVESAARLCAADMTTISREKDGHYHVVAAYGFPPGLQDYYETMPMDQGRGSLFGRILFERKPVQIVDVLADPEYAMRELQKRAGFRTVLGVPLLRDGVPIGLLSVNRTTVRPFTHKQIELVTAFADQAAIAIENVRLFDEIQDKSRQLEEASQHKSQFLANMSHELRTPLNAILGYTELMADGAYGEPSEKMLGILKRLEANGRHLLGLINDVLDLSKIEAGQLVLELSDYSVQDIAQTVRSTLEPLAADKKLAFKVDVASQLPPGRGDGRRLTQVLINLVGNAIKFTDVGEVAIKAEAKNGSFHVSVRDTGPGISSADQARLFQEFQQADNAITRKKGGTGLGLAISKRIIEMHGGRIWIESEPGQGSTFTFTLPVIVERQVEAA